jgi:FkbM family methyltransferase
MREPDVRVLTTSFDPSPWGARAPRGLDRFVLAVTRGMPDNWLGLRVAMIFRRIVMSKIGEQGIDTTLWGMRLRLYPRGNGCEKNALFTPQMYDVMERRVVAEAIDRLRPEHESFTFVDIGANVGLHSLFAAAHGGAHVRVLAIEPQPGILDRLRFNLAANPSVKVDVLPVAVADRNGNAFLVINSSDSGGTHIDKTEREAAADRITIPCRRLTDILADAGISAIDALKIDVEGAEDIALGPFLRDAPQSLLPRLIVIEDTSGSWTIDLFAMLAQCGYTELARSRQNVALRLA